MVRLNYLLDVHHRTFGTGAPTRPVARGTSRFRPILETPYWEAILGIRGVLLVNRLAVLVVVSILRSPGILQRYVMHFLCAIGLITAPEVIHYSLNVGIDERSGF